MRDVDNVLDQIDAQLALPDLPPLQLACPPRPVDPPVAAQQPTAFGLSPKQLHAALDMRNAMVQGRRELPRWLRWLAW